MHFSGQTRRIKKPALKKFIIFSPKTFFLYLVKWNFPAPRLKNFSRELSCSKIKSFLIFREMELSGLKIKNFLIFCQKKLFFYFGKRNFLAPRLQISKEDFPSSKYIKNPTLKTFHIFRERELSSPKKLVEWILTDVTS